MTNNHHGGHSTGVQADNILELGGVTTLTSVDKSTVNSLGQSNSSISVMKNVSINPTVLTQQSTNAHNSQLNPGNVVITAPTSYQYDTSGGATSSSHRMLHANNNLTPMQPRQDRPAVQQPNVQKLSGINYFTGAKNVTQSNIPTTTNNRTTTYYSINSLLDSQGQQQQQQPQQQHQVPATTNGTTAYNLTSLTTVQNHSNTVPLKPNPNLNSLNNTANTTQQQHNATSSQQQPQTTTTYQLQSLPPSSYYNTVNTQSNTPANNGSTQQHNTQHTYFNSNSYTSAPQQTTTQQTQQQQQQQQQQTQPVYQTLDPSQSSFATSAYTTHNSTSKIIPLKSYKTESVPKVLGHQDTYYATNQPYTSSTQVQFVSHGQQPTYHTQPLSHSTAGTASIDPAIAHQTAVTPSDTNSHDSEHHHQSKHSGGGKMSSAKRSKQHKFDRLDSAPRPSGAEHPPVRKGRGSNKIPKNPNQYFCPHCDKNYSTKGNLEQHVRANHLNTNYECPLCPGKSFKWASGLSIHKKKVHPGEKI